MCSESCRLELARTVCVALGAPSASKPIGAEFVMPSISGPQLLARRRTLWREFGCDESAPPPLRGKLVENGKSGSAFLVPGGGGVNLSDSATYSALFKQGNKQEATLLRSFYPKLVEHYANGAGSLLTPLLGWLRYVPPNGDAPFEALMLENAARCPPGSSSGVPMWRPFDMKGIRLYPHERRFAETFGARGLSVPARRAAELRRSLEADVRFLTDHGLVDFSYLISVWVAGPARDCDEVARDVEAAAAAAAVAVRASRTSASLIPAMYQLADVAPPQQQQALSPPQQQQALSPPQQQCVPVVLRMALIDYLREWMLLELFEDFRKTISRDLVAGERNHAVVPVAEFGQRFVSYFGEQLIRPLPATGLPLNLLSWASGTLRACAAVRLRWPQMRG